MRLDISTFVSDFACAVKAVDSGGPIARNARNGLPYQPGIGPHTETQTVELVMDHLRANSSCPSFTLNVPYPGVSRQRCDLCFGSDPQWEWAIELKLLRMMGDNGKPNDNMITHILSPYPIHRSALTDCEKLVGSDLPANKAVVIFGYDYEQYPVEPAIDAFETLCRARVRLGPRVSARFNGLIHPVHRCGAVFGWVVNDLRSYDRAG